MSHLNLIFSSQTFHRFSPFTKTILKNCCKNLIRKHFYQKNITREKYKQKFLLTCTARLKTAAASDVNFLKLKSIALISFSFCFTRSNFVKINNFFYLKIKNKREFSRKKKLMTKKSRDPNITNTYKVKSGKI